MCTGVVALILSCFIFTNQAVAKTSAAAKGVTPTATQSQAQLESTQQNLEQLRADLLSFVQAYKEFAAGVGMNKQAEAFEISAQQIRGLPLKQLDVLRNLMPDTARINSATQKLRAQVQLQQAKSRSSYEMKYQVPGPLTNSPGFPGADYPSCGSTRTSEAIIDASDIALFTAEAVREAASRACDEVIVVLGEGGNGSLVCIITDGIYIAAKIVNYGLHFCNDKIDQAELLASYARLDHLHSDLEASVVNDNANKTSIINNDNSNTTNIVANDNANKTSIINNDNTNTTNIINNDNANTTNILVNANANKNELRDLVLRTQIEADLASTDSAVLVALYLTPTAHGGYLDLVRTIVAQTIANIQASGGSTGQAASLLSQGDAARTAGDFKGAYTLYRKAYKAAAK
ncbi:MAG TPA: hypothetical protein DC047_20865 [Blastocatellia bacterium]|nr:hypothetical protein [Blastocatellia bacterium]